MLHLPLVGSRSGGYFSHISCSTGLTRANVLLAMKSSLHSLNCSCLNLIRVQSLFHRLLVYYVSPLDSFMSVDHVDRIPYHMAIFFWFQQSPPAVFRLDVQMTGATRLARVIFHILRSLIVPCFALVGHFILNVAILIKRLFRKPFRRQNPSSPHKTFNLLRYFKTLSFSLLLISPFFLVRYTFRLIVFFFFFLLQWPPLVFSHFLQTLRLISVFSAHRGRMPPVSS